MVRKLIAILVVLCVTVFSCIPAYAAESPSPSPDTGMTFWDYMKYYWGLGLLKDNIEFWNGIFTADDPKAAYQSALVPAGSGNLPFYLSLKKINADGSYIFSIIGDYSSHCQNSGSNSDYSYCFYSDGFSISTINASYPMNSFITDGTAGMIVPFDGIYYYGFSLNCSLIGNDPYVEGGILGGTYYAYTKDYNNYTAFNPNGTTVLVSGGLPILPTFIIKFCGRSCTGVISILPLVKGVPSSTFVPSVSSVGFISGDIYTTNDDGTTTVYKDCQFVDETNNKYFNPTTNNWTTYNSYTYDYSTMTYNFVTDAGTTTINYGDTNITYSETVNNVTNVYNYYYYVTPSASPSPSPVVSCDHDYSSVIAREASCTVAGITTYTCSKCGHTYTQPIDPLGHDWLKTDTVLTIYSLQPGTSCPTVINLGLIACLIAGIVKKVRGN